MSSTVLKKYDYWNRKQAKLDLVGSDCGGAGGCSTSCSGSGCGADD
ncbi:MAG: hypothetical protein Q7R70_05490 [Candidatus Diapherotrites archaeon]|nr:hypothetical protein [Candidatus Diapherotrites archaeon]